MQKSIISRDNISYGYLAALSSAAVLSTTAIMIRHLTVNYQLPALVLAFWRDVFVVVTLLPVLACFRPDLVKVSRQDLIYLGKYGLVLAMFNAFWTISVALNGAAVATVLVFCSTGFSALLGWWLLREVINGAKLLAIVFCLTGCALVSGVFDQQSWTANFMGIVSGGFSGLSYAIYGLMGRSATQRGLNPWTMVLFAFGFAAVILLVFNLIPGGVIPGTAVLPIDLFWLGKSLSGWGILFLLSAGPTVLGFGLCNVSLGYLPFSVVNLIVTLEPVFTTIIAYLLLGERFNSMQVWGGLSILGGVLLLRVYESRKSLPTD